MADKFVQAIIEMQEKEALAMAQQMLDSGKSAMEVLDLCREAMDGIGKRFEKGEYFISELLMGGEILRQIAAMAKPKMGEVPQQKKLGKVVFGTVAGDIHDLGKDIVEFMLDINGFEVHDLGVDVPAEKFVEAIKEYKPQVVGLSCLITVAFDSMKQTVEAITAAGLRDSVKIMIGGGTTDEQVKSYAGADAYGKDAVAAVNLTKKWVGGKSNG
jgi:5-methyltetrahydrofolate--homocysteine methyltransferase